MKKCLYSLVSVMTIIALSSSSHAISPFKKVFDATYVKDSGDEAFQTEFRKTGCYVCHVHKKKKDFVNAYGWELATLIEGNAKDRIADARKNGKDAKTAEEDKLSKELELALRKVEAMKSASGKTYGEMFKAKELPGEHGGKSIRED